MSRLLVRNARLPDGRVGVDLLAEDGRILALGEGIQSDGAEQVIEANRRLLAPPFVESHLHLDKALLTDRLPARIGSVQEAIAATAALKRGFTRADILDRADRTLRMALRHGTLAARVHAEVDPILGLTSLEAMLELRERWRDTVTLQIVAFPQDGIQRQPGTLDLLREALRLGADVIGGVPYVDPDQHAHIETVLDLAMEFDRRADFHLDFSDDSTVLNAPYLARRVIETGLHGQVAVGHLTALAALPPADLEPIVDLIARADISVLVLPATDLHLGGRGDAWNARRGLAPVRRLLQGGVTVACSSNNVRNAFTPFGNSDLLEVGLLAMVGCHLSDREDVPTVFDMLTVSAARAIGLSAYGLELGQPASFVIFEAPTVWEALVGQAEKRYVVANGRVVAENRREHRLHGPE